MERENLEILMSNIISLTRDDNKLMTIQRGAGKKGREVISLGDWKEECRSYFRRYYKTLNIIFGPSDADTIMEILGRVCSNNNDQGFVFKDYDIMKHLQFLGYDENLLEKKIGTALPNGIISYLTYIKQKNVILVCKKNTAGQNGKECMKNVSVLVKLFISLYSKDLQLTGVTVIGLLITEEETENKPVKCDFCNLLSPSHKVFKSLIDCKDWLKYFEHFVDFEIPKEGNTLLNDLAGEILCFMAVQSWRKDLPNLAKNKSEQLKQTYLLLTPQQMKLHFSDDRHIIIQGSYGTGKSVLGVKKIEHILEDIEKREAHNEKIFYINFDRKSNLHYQMEKYVKEYIRNTSGKIKVINDIGEVLKSPQRLVYVHHNSAGRSLSFMLQQALKINNMEQFKTANFHFVVEEYDGEMLTHEEAETLTMLTNNNFEQSSIIILAQPLAKQRGYIVKRNMYEKETCMFNELKNFKVVKLEKALRYSNEICTITKYAQQLVQDQETVFRTEKDKLEFIKQQEDQDNKSYLVKLTHETLNDGKGLNSSINCKQSKKIPDDIVDLDQAFVKLASVKRKNRGNKIVSKFHFIAEPKQGVDINGGDPVLYEFSDDIQSFKDIVVTFTALLLLNFISENEATVLLHLSRKTPEILKKAVQVLRKHPQSDFLYTEEIDKYFEAVDKSTKIVFLTNFSQVNGLEFDHVIIFANNSEYYLKQYLPQAISRCTYNLKIVLLPMETINTAKGIRKILNKIFPKKDKIKTNDTVASMANELVGKDMMKKVLVDDCKSCANNHSNCFESGEKYVKVHTHSTQYEDIVKLTKNSKIQEVDFPEVQGAAR